MGVEPRAKRSPNNLFHADANQMSFGYMGIGVSFPDVRIYVLLLIRRGASGFNEFHTVNIIRLTFPIALLACW